MTRFKNFHSLKLASIVSVLLTLLPSNVHADECLGALMRDYSSINLDSAVSFALMDAAQKDLTEDESKSIGVTVPIYGVPVNLNAATARSVTSSFYNQTNLNWDRRTRISIIQQHLPSTSVEAYRICVEGQREFGPKITVHEVTNTDVSLSIKWVAGPQQPTDAKAEFIVRGGEPLGELPDKWSNADKKTFIFERNLGENFRLAANIGGDTDQVFLAFVPKIKVEVETGVVSHPPVASDPLRMADDGTARNQGPISGCLDAPQGAQFNPDSANVDISVKVGPLDSTTYAKITRQTAERVCWESFLRPLVKGQGGDFRFRVNAPYTIYKFSVDEG